MIDVGFTSLDRAALAVTIGVAATWLWLLPPRHSAPAQVASRLTRTLGFALLALVVTGAASLVLRSMVMGEVDLTQVGPIIPKVITRSQYGQWWSLRALIWLGLVLAWLGVWRRPEAARTVRWAIAGGAAATAFVFSATGHAGDNGSLTVSNIVNWLHIAAGCLWGGTVAVYAAAVLPPLGGGASPRAELAHTATRLSTLAGSALAVVLITGLYNAWHQIDALSNLWSTAYGRTLLIKLTGVAAMMAVGAVNRFFVVPSIEARAAASHALAGTFDSNERKPAQRFLRILRVDTLIFVFVLICAVQLGSQTPPRNEPQHHAGIEVDNGNRE